MFREAPSIPVHNMTLFVTPTIFMSHLRHRLKLFKLEEIVPNLEIFHNGSYKPQNNHPGADIQAMDLSSERPGSMSQ